MTSLMEFSSDQNLNLPSIILRTNSPQFAAVLAELENQEHDDKQKHEQPINTKPVIQPTQAAEKDSGFAKHDTDINDNSTKYCFSENASKSDDVLCNQKENKPEDNIGTESEERVYNDGANMFRQQNNHSNNSTSKDDYQHRLSRDRAKEGVKNEHTSIGDSYFRRREFSPAHLEKLPSLSLAQNHTIDVTQDKDAETPMTKIKVEKYKIDLTLNVKPDKTDETTSSDVRTVKREVWFSPKLQRKSKTPINSHNLPSLGTSLTKSPHSVAKSTSSVAKLTSTTRHLGSSMEDAKATFTKATAPLSPRSPRRILSISQASSKHERQNLSNSCESMDTHQSPSQARKRYILPSPNSKTPTSPISPHGVQSPERTTHQISPEGKTAASSQIKPFGFTASISSKDDETSESESPRSPSKPCSPRSPNSSSVLPSTNIPKPPSSQRPARLQVNSPGLSPRCYRPRTQSSPSVSPSLQRRASPTLEITLEVKQKFCAFWRSVAQSPLRKSQAFNDLKQFASTIINQVDEDNDDEDLPEVSMSDVLKTWHVTDNNEMKVLKHIGVRDRTYSAPTFTTDQAMELKDCRYLRRRNDDHVNNNNE